MSVKKKKMAWGRQALLNHIMEEHRLGGVEIDACDLNRVRDLILYETIIQTLPPSPAIGII